MDVYLCSTVRHFMLATLRACKEPEQALLIVVLDQQNLTEESFNTSCLPDNIRVMFVNRKLTLRKVYSGLTGQLHKIYTTFNFSFSQYIKNRTKRQLLDKYLDHEMDDSDQLFLFNDRNRLSRLLRTYYRKYQVIEDGLSNYFGWKLRLWEKCFNFNRAKRRYIGDNKNCVSIYLINPENAPEVLKSKTKKIDFISSNNVKRYLFPLFKVKVELPDLTNAIIATQPISSYEFTKSGTDLVAYKKIKQHAELLGRHVVIKVHPREEASKYEAEFKNCYFIDSKLPLELILFSLQEKIDIYSIYSTAGIGFEDFCNRHTLIKDEESNKQHEVLLKWINDHKSIADRVKEIIG